MRAVHLPFSKRKMQDLSRELYREHGWQMPRGFVRHQERDPRNFTLAEWQQCKRAKRDPAKMKEVFQDAWAISDSRIAFSNALESHGLILAKGDRRGHVAVDHNGEAYAVSRYVGIKAKQVRDRLGDPANLPAKNQAHKQAALRVADRLTEIKAEQQLAAQARLKKLDEDLRKLETSQRTEAARLHAQQREQKRKEFAQQQARLRTGFRGILDRLTGRRKKTQLRNRNEARLAEMKVRAERAELQTHQERHQKLITTQSTETKKREAYVQRELTKDAENLRSGFERQAESKTRTKRPQRQRRSRGDDGPTPSR